MKGWLEQLVALFWATVALLVMVCVTLALMAEVTSVLGYLAVLAVLAITVRIVWAKTRGW